ncbi:hypothetical protein M5689_002294 [Euphorbia peplus]|nr:hypothetical protein M5689_002294 [Euphorbia peplus]
MVSGRNESKLGHKNLEIEQDDKFFTRIMSKDTSMANSSTRVYYGGASGSVPFMWESRPGTPKHTFSDTSNIPPLTPPPSYFLRSKSKSKQNSLFPRFRKRNTHVSPSSSMSSTTTATTSSSSFSTSSSSASWSSFHSSTRSMSILPKSRKHLCFTCSSSSIHDNEEDDEDDDVVDKEVRAFGSRASKLQRNGVNKGRYLMKNMKNAFFAIIGHGSS